MWVRQTYGEKNTFNKALLKNISISYRLRKERAIVKSSFVYFILVLFVIGISPARAENHAAKTTSTPKKQPVDSGNRAIELIRDEIRENETEINYLEVAIADLRIPLDKAKIKSNRYTVALGLEALAMIGGLVLFAKTDRKASKEVLAKIISDMKAKASGTPPTAVWGSTASLLRLVGITLAGGFAVDITAGTITLNITESELKTLNDRLDEAERNVQQRKAYVQRLNTLVEKLEKK